VANYANDSISVIDLDAKKLWLNWTASGENDQRKKVCRGEYPYGWSSRRDKAYVPACATARLSIDMQATRKSQADQSFAASRQTHPEQGTVAAVCSRRQQ